MITTYLLLVAVYHSDESPWIGNLDRFYYFYLSHTAQNVIAILPALFIIDYIDFHIQAERLSAYFGDSAFVKSKVTSRQIVTVIDYPLQDVGI